MGTCYSKKDAKQIQWIKAAVVKVENKKVCRKVSLNSLSKLAKTNKIPIKIVTKADEIKL